MNKIKSLLCVLPLLMLVCACDSPEFSSLSIKTSRPESAVELKVGDEVELKIEAKDDDGISSIEVNASVFGIQDFYDQIGKKNWTKTQVILIDAATASGTAEIQVTMKDDTGEEMVSSTFLEIQ